MKLWFFEKKSHENVNEIGKFNIIERYFFIYFLHKIFSVEKKGSEEIFCFMEVSGKCVGKIPSAINKGDFVGSFDKR